MWKCYPVRLGLSPDRRWGPAPRAATCQGMICVGKEREGARWFPTSGCCVPAVTSHLSAAEILLLPYGTCLVSTFPSHTHKVRQSAGRYSHGVRSCGNVMAQVDAAPVSLAPVHCCGGGRGCGMGAAPCQGLWESLSGQILVYPLAYAVANHGACQHDVNNPEFLEFKVAVLGTIFVTMLNCFTFYSCCQETFTSSKTPGGTQTDQSFGFLWCPSSLSSPLCLYLKEKKANNTQDALRCTRLLVLSALGQSGIV